MSPPLHPGALRALLTAWALLLALGSHAPTASAGQPALPSPAASLAAWPSWTLPTPSLLSLTKPLSALLWERARGGLLAAAQDSRWPMPTRHPWPTHHGLPIITTARVHELTYTLDGRRDLRWILSRYRIRRDALSALNPQLDLDALTPGQTLTVWRRDPHALSQSKWRPSLGRLIDGEPMPQGPGYVILYEHRAFGTYYTVSELTRVLRNHHARHPLAHPLIVGDLSYRDGGLILPHLSHRSGRDVDLTYPRHSEPPSLARFTRIRRPDLDLDATLELLRDLIAGGAVELILIDRPIQRLLAQRAQALGAPQAWIRAVFQHPHRQRDALVRDARGHDDHMHIRFACQLTDPRCL